MKYTKSLAIAAAATALALMAFAGSASATTLATHGTKQTGAVTIEATGNGSILWKDTAGNFANTCTESKLVGTTSTFTGTVVSGPLSTFTFNKCTREPVVTDAAGTLSVEVIGSGPNGTVRSNGTKTTVPSPFGTLTCTTSNTDIGTLTGATAGTSEIDINAVMNCGFFLPSAKWEGSYNITGHSISVVS